MKLQGFLISKDFLSLVMCNPCSFIMPAERTAHDTSSEEEDPALACICQA